MINSSIEDVCRQCYEGYAFLAGPYTSAHNDPDMRRMQLDDRYNIHKRAAANLVCEEIAIYSPIVAWHQVAADHNLPTDANFWSNLNEQFLRKASALYVLEIPGWEDSVGTKHEMNMAREFKTPMFLGSFDARHVQRFPSDASGA